MTVGADRTVADYRQILAYFKALDAASPRVEVEILGKTTLGRGPLPGRDLVRGEPREQEAPAGDRAQDRRPARADGGRDGRARPRGQGLPLHHLQHPLDRDRRLARWPWSGRTRWPPPGRGDETAARRGGPAAAPVDQPRRADHGDRVVPEEPRHAVRGRPDAVALPPLRRPRQQPRLVHAQPEGDAGRLPRPLPRVAAAGLARRAPDGLDRARASSPRPTRSRSTPTSTPSSGAT